MDADANHIARLNGGRVELFQRFITDLRGAIDGGCRRSEHVEPPGRDNGSSEGDVAWINEMYGQVCAFFQMKFF
jgi:hypothetical protein